MVLVPACTVALADANPNGETEAFQGENARFRYGNSVFI
jgi:hypothetical protein